MKWNPLLKKLGNFSLYSLNFCPNFSSQTPKFGSFQLTSPQIWRFSVHKPPLPEASISSQAPHFGNPGHTPLPEKKSWVPPQYLSQSYLSAGVRGKISCFSSYWFFLSFLIFSEPFPNFCAQFVLSRGHRAPSAIATSLVFAILQKGWCQGNEFTFGSDIVVKTFKTVQTFIIFHVTNTVVNILSL